MAYNYFPASYQPYQMPQPNTAGIIWIQGEAGAKSYMVAPNTTAVLFDSESQTIYLKSADATGMPSIRVLDYTIRDNTPKTPGNAVLQHKGDYPTREEFDALKSQINALEKKLGKGCADESTISAGKQ